MSVGWAAGKRRRGAKVIAGGGGRVRGYGDRRLGMVEVAVVRCCQGGHGVEGLPLHVGETSDGEPGDILERLDECWGCGGCACGCYCRGDD